MTASHPAGPSIMIPLNHSVGLDAILEPTETLWQCGLSCMQYRTHFSCSTDRT